MLPRLDERLVLKTPNDGGCYPHFGGAMAVADAQF
jgi:hypothetical protein